MCTVNLHSKFFFVYSFAFFTLFWRERKKNEEKMGWWVGVDGEKISDRDAFDDE